MAELIEKKVEDSKEECGGPRIPTQGYGNSK
jgi:hypothetical protein